MPQKYRVVEKRATLYKSTVKNTKSKPKFIDACDSVNGECWKITPNMGNIISNLNRPSARLCRGKKLVIM